jgi:plasmid replication initiation protein
MVSAIPNLTRDSQPDRTTIVWQQNRLAEARYELTPREQKLVLYVISMIEPEDEFFKLHKINVKHFAQVAGLDANALYKELREVALQIKSKPLVIEGHMEPGDTEPTELITSWFADVVMRSNGDGYIGVAISERLKPYLLQVKREFFKYRLAFVLKLRSGYAIRLYQWAKRWQYAGKRRVSIDDLRVMMGTVELTPKGNISKTFLALYKDFKKRALLPAVKEINQKTDISVSFIENKKGKAVDSLTFTIGENSKASELETVTLAPEPQLELTLSVPDEENEAAATMLLRKIKDEFGLSAPQLKAVEKSMEINGLIYIEEKVAVVNSEPRDNAARTFLAAIKGDWKLPVKLKPLVKRKALLLPEQVAPEMTAEEWEANKEKTRQEYQEFKKKMTGFSESRSAT